MLSGTFAHSCRSTPFVFVLGPCPRPQIEEREPKGRTCKPDVGVLSRGVRCHRILLLHRSTVNADNPRDSPSQYARIKLSFEVRANIILLSARGE